ncbi:MAG: glycoside hydrolase [Candidatus Hydrogenedentes bacterium]|nr:glycoside hydrolase [Candidatus Hydrogenedentota bacterium]
MKKLCGLGIVAAVLAVGPVWAEAAFSSEFIFPGQSKHVHGSTIVECPNGDLLAAWFYGSGERNANDVLIQGARMRQGSSEWSEPFLMADTPFTPDCNPVLFIDPKERLWLFWVAVRANGWEHSLLKYRRAENFTGDGAPEWTWQDAILLKPGDEFVTATEQAFEQLDLQEYLWAEYAMPYSKQVIEASKDKAKREEGWMTRQNPVVLPSGRILLPLYSDGFNMSLMAISDDLGETWTPSLPIVGLGPIQPAVVRKQDGTLYSYMRDSGGLPKRALWSESKDDGMTWTPAIDTDIPNPGSSLAMIALKDGRWVMAFNDADLGRHVLTMALSDDEGKTWKWKRDLERAEPREGSYAYPGLVEGADGRVHITYTFNEGDDNKTIKHAAFAPVWILE